MSKTKVPVWFYGLLLILGAVVVWRVVAPSSAHATHPAPRAGVTAEKVVASSRYGTDAEVARVYSMAARIPNVLDGLYCHCK